MGRDNLATPMQSLSHIMCLCSVFCLHLIYFVGGIVSLLVLLFVSSQSDLFPKQSQFCLSSPSRAPQTLNRWIYNDNDSTNNNNNNNDNNNDDNYYYDYYSNNDNTHNNNDDIVVSIKR